MNNSVRFGIVGCGMIADFHARALAQVTGGELTACSSRSPESSAAFSERYGCACFATVEEMVSSRQVDAICVCTPSGAHLEPTLTAAHHGVHVVVEKPLEVTLARCDRMIEACDRAGVRLSTIFQSRFHDGARNLKSAVDEGRFGKLSLGTATVKWFRDQDYYDKGPWRGTWRLDGGGALMNQAIHNVDLLLWIMGKAISVTARTATIAHQRIEVEDTAVAIVEFANGALGTIQATTASWPGWRKRLEFSGSDGSAILEDDRLVRWDFRTMRETDTTIAQSAPSDSNVTGGATGPSSIGVEGHIRQLEDFVIAIRDNRSPAVDGREARKSVELIRAIYRSADARAPVKLAGAEEN